MDNANSIYVGLFMQCYITGIRKGISFRGCLKRLFQCHCKGGTTEAIPNNPRESPFGKGDLF